MDINTKKFIEEFQQRFNEGLPCRVQFPRKVVPGFMDDNKTLPNPGPQEHTGWITKMWFDGKKFDFDVAFKDPLAFDKDGKVVRLPHDLRKWKTFTLCSFVHTCYFNWDVTGSVSLDKTYTRPAQTSLLVELEPSASTNLSHAVVLKDLIPLRKKGMSIDEWALRLNHVPCPKRHADCPVNWTELQNVMTTDPPRGRRSLKGIDQLGSMCLLRVKDELTSIVDVPIMDTRSVVDNPSVILPSIVDNENNCTTPESAQLKIRTSTPSLIRTPTPSLIRTPAAKRVFEEITMI